MYIKNFFLKVFSLLSSIFLLFIGVFILFITWASQFREATVKTIEHRPEFFTIISIVFLITSIVILVVHHFVRKKHYYKIEMGKHNVSINKNVIEKYVTYYWNELNLEKEIQSQVIVKNNKLHIIADFPSIPINQQGKHLSKN